MSAYDVVRIDRGDPRLDAALSMLHDEFASRGEIERPEVIDSWLARGPRREATRDIEYQIYAALAPDGSVVGARDCHLVTEGDAAVLYLAHVVVSWTHRRHGLGTRLREIPIAAAKERSRDLIVAGEMEHPDPTDSASVVRLVAYGRAGFAAVSPEAMPYWQPDFRDPEQIDTPRPVPLLAVVKRIGHDEPTLPKGYALRVLDHLYAVFADHCAEAHLAFTRERTRAAIEAWPGDSVPLLPLPRSLGDDEALAPLARPA